MERLTSRLFNKIQFFYKGAAVALFQPYIIFPVMVVSFAAVIRVVTQRSSPLTSGEERCVTTLITAAKETTVMAAGRNNLLPWLCSGSFAY